MNRSGISRVHFWIAALWAVGSGFSFGVELISFQGDLSQGSLVLGLVEPRYKVNYKGEPLKLAPSGQFLLGLGRDSASVMEVSLEGPDGETTVHSFEIKKRRYNVQAIEGVPQRTVSPSQADLTRIKRDSLMVRKARQLRLEKAFFLGGFEAPIEGPVTGVYGSQRVYNGVPKSPHYGVDYAAPTGTVVSAPAGGIITMAEIDLFYSGGTLIMDHGHGLTSSFLHLSAILVQVGDLVQRGDSIAQVGATGRATGPHLDWRMNWHQVRVDPQLVLKALPLK
ncbi:MAG TPA: M23 family metallopeptidase [Gammaproteobacteria bacterium]|nr:M23 family metallopeptidase [Gammaproteobacteria bacterium]